MKDNYNLRIDGNKVLLVPYRRTFVENYHKWMSDPDLLVLTASEPLALKEEYEMQISWHIDPKKCTFILLQKSKFDESKLTGRKEIDCEISSMCGDVNLFFNNYENSSDAEIEVMIAEPDCRRQGIAFEAVSIMMRYGIQKLGAKRFFAKISSSNEASQKLFRRLGFEECNYVACFDEHEYHLMVDEDVKESILDSTKYIIEREYEVSD
mmetsp:Transcript_6513/g.9081  ORF Transcript_6513/g.9081 Transcript_6513/m.9081 type:complete len:209 (-) Transcript_6513:2877-3503(-)